MSVEEGLKHAAEYFKKELEAGAAPAPALAGHHKAGPYANMDKYAKNSQA